jgi:hypothetical protein
MRQEFSKPVTMSGRGWGLRGAEMILLRKNAEVKVRQSKDRTELHSIVHSNTSLLYSSSKNGS